MNRFEEIKERYAPGKVMAYSYAEELAGRVMGDSRYLLAKLELAEQALDEFTEKHFHGGSKANRDDYVSLGIPTSDIYKLREALKAIRE